MMHICNSPHSPRLQNPLLPPALEEVLLRCLEKEPAWRFQDGNALAHALAQLEERASQTSFCNITHKTPMPTVPIPCHISWEGQDGWAGRAHHSPRCRSQRVAGGQRSAWSHLILS